MVQFEQFKSQTTYFLRSCKKKNKKKNSNQSETITVSPDFQNNHYKPN